MTTVLLFPARPPRHDNTRVSLVVVLINSHHPSMCACEQVSSSLSDPPALPHPQKVPLSLPISFWPPSQDGPLSRVGRRTAEASQHTLHLLSTRCQSMLMAVLMLITRIIVITLYMLVQSMILSLVPSTLSFFLIFFYLFPFFFWPSDLSCNSSSSNPPASWSHHYPEI